VCILFFVRTQLANHLVDQLRNSFLSQWLPHLLLTMDSIEVDILLVDEACLKHWDCTLMFDVAGLEGEHDILQYVKPNFFPTNDNVQNFKKGLICSHHHHERQVFVFSSRTGMDEHVEKMVKQFAMTSSSPSTCVRMLHRMDNRLYDVQTVANIFNKAKNSLLEEKGVDTSSTKAQQLMHYLMINPDTNAVFFIHHPSSALFSGRQKGRPNKKRENHLVLLTMMSNKEASMEELVFDRDYTVDDYAQAHRHALYLPDSEAILLYGVWCTNEELQMATMFGSFWTLDTTPMTNIEDRPLTIMAGMYTNRKSCPHGRAFLPSEGEWVFDFSMVVALTLLYGNNVIRNIQQVTTDGDRQI
jgi:hypothetical protein